MDKRQIEKKGNRGKGDKGDIKRDLNKIMRTNS